MINSKTQLLGLLGYPVSHSFSPTLHNAVMEAVDFNGAYLAMPVEPMRLKEAIYGLKAINFLGVNVTVPHKSACMEFLDEISETAKNIGAVNTIIHRDGKLLGDNTDSYGFIKLVEETMDTSVVQHAGILGAGGSAKSVLVSLVSMGINEISVFTRNKVKGDAFIDTYKNVYPDVQFNWINISDFRTIEPTLDLLINCTPVGMHPNVDDTPIQLEKPKTSLVFIDLVYNPERTALIKQCDAMGLKSANGIQMLIYQAAKSFELWTDIPCESLYLTAAKETL